MSKGRMEAFSDGVMAIIITIMVLELHVSGGADLEALRHVASPFLSYVLSFVFLGIYWHNHHHLMQAVQHVTGGILWANSHLLFWLSLTPAITAWMGETHFAPWPVAIYGVVLLMSAVAYFILTHTLLAHHDRNSPIAIALGNDFKGKISIALYVAAVAVAFWSTLVSCMIYVLVEVLWILPDRRIEKTLTHRS